MTTHDIDETLKKIDKDLAENEQPLPKAAPTQHHLNQRPPEREVDLTVASFEPERLRELQELASLARVRYVKRSLLLASIIRTSASAKL